MKTAIKAASALAFILIFSVSLFAEGYPTSTPAANATAVVSGTVLDNATGETLA